jgi:hypothetical protein
VESWFPNHQEVAEWPEPNGGSEWGYVLPFFNSTVGRLAQPVRLDQLDDNIQGVEDEEFDKALVGKAW